MSENIFRVHRFQVLRSDENSCPSTKAKLSDGREKQIMAHLWRLDGTTWGRQPLDRKRVELNAQPDGLVQNQASLPTGGEKAVLGCYELHDQPPHWVLLVRASTGVRVNGQPLLGGIAVLKDRDEILLGGRTRVYFSTEEEAKVESFPGGERPVFCARCRQSIQPGTPAVRCPSCGHWSEQSESKPCWTYGPSCPLCDQPTAFDAGLRWTPEEL